MPRAKKTSEDEVEPKSVRRTRQTSVVTDSPVRRSTRNKPAVDSSPESVKENIKEFKRVLRKRTPTPDVELSQTTRNLRKRNIRSESEVPSTPPRARVTRKTRANSVIEDIHPKNKKSVATPVKGRRRLISVSTKPLVEEENVDLETSEKTLDEKQNSSHFNSERTDDDQPQETSTSSKEDEIEDSSTALLELAAAEDSITIIDEITGVKSVVKKKEKYTAIEKRLMSRLLTNKLNFSNNDSLVESKNDDPQLKEERVSSIEELQNSNSENEETEENSEEKMAVVNENNTEVFKGKSPRKSSGKISSREKSFGEEGGNKLDNLNNESSEEMKKETPYRKNTPNKKESPEKEKTPYKKQTPHKTETPNKKVTPNEKETFNKNETPNKTKTPNRTNTPEKMVTPKTSKDRTPAKRFSNELSVDESPDLNDETEEDYFLEPMDVDISDPDLANNSDHRETDSENTETTDVPERMSRDFKPRKSMIEVSNKKQVFKERYSLGNKKLESVVLDISIEKEKYRERKNRKSRERIDSESVNLKSKSSNDLSSEENVYQIYPTSENRSSIGKRKSSSEKRDSISEKRKSISEKRDSISEKRNSISRKRDSYSLSNSPTSFQLSVTPEKCELLKSKETSISLSKSSEKKSRKRKRENSDDSLQLTMLGYDEESFLEKDVDKLDMTLTEENSDEDQRTSKNRKSLSKRKSKSLNANEFAKEEEKKKTPKSLRKEKRLSEELKKEEVSELGEKPRISKHNNRSLLMSESLEEGEILDLEEENLNSENEELKNHSEFSDKNHKRRSKSFEGTKIPKNRKSLDKKSSFSCSLNNEVEVSEEKEASNSQESSENEEDAESESEVRKSDFKNQESNIPVIKNIEILQKKYANNVLVQRLKSSSEEQQISEKTPNKSQMDEKKLREAGESEESSEEKSSNEDEAIVTIKKARKSQSIGTTPSLTPMKSRFHELEDQQRSGKKSKLGKKMEEEDSENVDSKIPAFMFSQTSSESEDDEKGSAEEASRSIDSDIAKEYNLSGKTIHHYSDDDVPADVCRASESEHSDSEDEGSDLADFVVENEEEESEDEEESDDSVFKHDSGKSPKEYKRIVNMLESEDDNEEKEPSPSKDKETRRNRNSSLKLTDQDRQIQEQEGKISEDEGQIQEQERKIHEMETLIQEHEMQIQEDEFLEKQVKKTFDVSSDKSTEQIQFKNDESIIDENKENLKKLKSKKKKKGNEPELPKSENENQTNKRNEEVEVDQNRKRQEGSPEVESKDEARRKKKSKRELKSTASKLPVASSTRYEMYDSQEEPETLSFADARNEELEAIKKKSESIKAAKEAKKKKKKDEKAKVVVNSGNVKRLPDDLIEDLEDAPRPKKRQKMSKKEDFQTPSLGMHDRRFSHSFKQKSLVSASACGSTTDFEVISLQKEKKSKSQSSLALKWFKQRMLARNIRQPISVYLSQQQKRRAAGKDHF